VRRPAGGAGPRFESVILGLVSAAVIAMQLALVRSLSIASYYHFVYLVISTALLGFGASGTLLALLPGSSARYRGLALVALLAFAATSSWALRAALAVPLDLYYLLYSLREAARLWMTTLILFLPFFAGGLFIGAVLRERRNRAGATYAANLLGSAAGGIAVLPVLGLTAPSTVQLWIGLGSLGLAVLWLLRSWGELPRRRLWALLTVLVAASCLASVALPFEVEFDQYKGGAFARRLQQQSDADLLATARSPVARWDAFDARSMHHTLFAAPGAPEPPEQVQLMRDGFLVGALFDIEGPEEAPILDALPQSLAYAALENPRVLLLGENSGANIWLALKTGASSVTAVVPDSEFTELMRGPLSGRGGSVFADPRVTVVSLDPRNALERLRGPFDLIHVATTEGVPAAGAGLLSLQEDYLLTVEAIEIALEKLRRGGLISATRGLQSPPRDNLRLFSLFARAMGRRGASGESHLFQARNYLAATTILSGDPFDPRRVERLRSRAGELSMDVDYFPGITPADLTEINRLAPGRAEAGARGSPGSPYYQAALALLSDERAGFIDSWLYDISAPTDDQPYFHDFFVPSQLGTYMESYGHLWFSRLELGIVVVVVTLLQAFVAGVALILLPILVARRRRKPASPGADLAAAPVADLAAAPEAGRTTAWTVLHFALIGLGFMAIEMLFIQRGIRVLGDPVYSTAAVITALLAWAGLGSAVQGRLSLPPGRTIAVGGAAVVATGVLTLLVLEAAGGSLARLGGAPGEGGAARFASFVVILGPVSFCMGWLFPAAVSWLDARGGDVGLAWAVNGVASVVAAPLAVLVASSFGFSRLAAGAFVCYMIVAVVGLFRERG
jgi:spermidine synthase